MSAQPKPVNDREAEYQLHAEFIGLVFNADEKSTSKQRDELDKFLREHPEMLEGERQLADNAERDLIAHSQAGHYGFIRLTQQEVKELRESLEYENATAIEKLLIDRVVLCWLRVMIGESYATRSRRCDRPTFREMEFSDRLLTAAQSRFMRAVKTLTNFKKLTGKPQSSADVLRLASRK